jgi:hypothetical protein
MLWRTSAKTWSTVKRPPAKSTTERTMLISFELETPGTGRG